VGPVVEPVHVDELVKPFRRAEANGHGRGLGLGLSIVQAIIEAHGAKLHTEARAEGGLRVSVAFPAAGPASSD
jgi:signal transduction histidine kinase